MWQFEQVQVTALSENFCHLIAAELLSIQLFS